MRLMQPSPGEAYDRMTILVLKIKHSDRQEFKVEHGHLVKYMQEMFYKIPTDLADELGRINSRLWELEDRQRSILRDGKNGVISDTMHTDFFNNAISVIELNDARAETVRKINVACGIDSMEKLHGTH